jgi:hypothetical protein
VNWKNGRCCEGSGSQVYVTRDSSCALPLTDPWKNVRPLVLARIIIIRLLKAFTR